MLGAPTRLRCEYLSNPLGIDETRPRLSWWVDDDRPAELQTAYRILAASSPQRLAAEEGDLWDSGRVASHQTLNVEYHGGPLSTGQRVWWSVRSFDSDGLPSPWSEPAFFEVGPCGQEDWSARWIGASLMGGAATSVQVPVFRRGFELPEAALAARLHVAALGVCAVEINGQRVGRDELTPGWTDFRKRVRYRTYDVTDHLQTGENALGALLGDGWYCGHPGAGQRQQYGDRPLLLAQLNITLASGATIAIGTDEAWKWRPSWLLQADVLGGESVDARQRIGDWSSPGCADDGWDPAQVHDLPDLTVCASMHPPIRAQGVLEPVADAERRDDPVRPPRWIFDFGQNLLGRVLVSVKAAAGSGVRVRYAESLGPTDDFGDRAGDGVDWYTASGVPGGETFEPTFSVHGFRYVEVCGDLADDEPGVVAVAVNTDLDATATFESDHPLLDRLHANIVANQRGCALDVPNAGFSLERRIPLTGEARAFLGTAAMNLDVAAFLAKWLTDLADAQLPDGGFPSVAPVPPLVPALQQDGGPGWSDAFAACAWILYRHFGDRRVLERNYPALRTYVLGQAAAWPDCLARPGSHPLGPADRGAVASLKATALFLQAVRLASRIAGVLGNLSDFEQFDGLAQSIRSAFRNRFVTHDGLVVGDCVTSYTLALHLGLLERGERRAAFEELVAKLEDGEPPAVEPLAAPYLLGVLTRGGRVDLAYLVLLGSRPGSWLYPVLHGASSLWDGETESSRLARGSVGEWLYTGLAGLDLDDDLSETNNAFRRIRIQPHPPLRDGIELAGNVPPMRRVKASLDTVHGRYESAWEILEDGFVLRVQVPGNCSALVVMPDGTEHEVVAGRHEFKQDFLGETDEIPILREIAEAS